MIKRKYYKAVVKQAMVYGAEMWTGENMHDNLPGVAEMRMLLYMIGVWSHTDGQSKKRKKYRGNESVRNIQESASTYVKV